MNIHAESKEEYFTKAGEREPALRRLDVLIQDAAPHLKPVLFSGMGGGVGLGYGMQPYKTKSMKVATKWPLIAVMNQKHHISLYICAVDTDGQYIAEKNADRLGKVSCGKSCIRFKNMDDLNARTLDELIRDIDTRVTAGEKLFGI